MSKVYVSQEANPILKAYLLEAGHSLIEVSARANIDKAISTHPDIYMCHLGKSLYMGDPEKLACDYPGHAIYNACSTGKYFIHNLKHTDLGLKQAATDAGLEMLHVSQGYAKCSCVVVHEDAIITADLGIFNVVKEANLNVLLVSKGQVALPGYPYGFIGGASGKVGNSMIFNGDITAHSDYEKIRQFVEANGLEMVYFKDYPLTDIGSIIEAV